MVNLYEQKRRLIKEDWREQETKERSFKKGHKYLVHEAGVLSVKVLISDSKKTRPKTYYGTSSTRTDVKLNFRELMRTAVLNAVMKHYSAGGKTSPQVEVLDYKIQYFDDIIQIKRENIEGKYFNVVRLRKNNAILQQEKYKRNELSQFDVKNADEYFKNYVDY